MGGRLDLPRLHELCGSSLPQVGGNARAREIVAAFGPLATIWLKPEVLDRAHAWQCEMAGEPLSIRPAAATTVERGEVGILLATTDGDSLPLVRPAFVLPVQWRKGAGSSQRLPQGLAEFAAVVLRDVGIDGLSLHLSPSLEAAGADFSGLRFSPDSAWAALAAAAIVAKQAGVTKPGVLVSAARTHGNGQFWITRIDGLDAKLAAAAAAGAQIVFLPKEHEEEAQQWKASHPDATFQMRYLSNQSGPPHRILADVLHAMEAAPSKAAGASDEACRDYFVRMPDEGHNEYYRDELAASIIDTLRPRLETDERLRDAERLVIIASKSWSLGLLLAGLFDPREVLVFHDGKLDTAVSTLTKTLPSFGREGKPSRVVREARCRPGDFFTEDVATNLRAFADGGGRVVIDLTAGYREFHFAILAALPENAEVVFVSTDQDQRYARAKPGTERLRRLVIPRR